MKIQFSKKQVLIGSLILLCCVVAGTFAGLTGWSLWANHITATMVDPN